MAGRFCNVPSIMRSVDSSFTEPLAGAAPRRFINGEYRDEVREEENLGEGKGNWEEDGEEHSGVSVRFVERMREMEAFIAEIFDAVSTVKKAYVGLQEAHCPWDPDRIRVADVGVVTELRKLVCLRDRFRRGVARDCGGGGGPRLVEVSTPHEAALDNLRREIKAKEVEIEKLKEKLRSGRRGRTHPSGRVGCIRSLGSPAAPSPELFQCCMEQVKSASKSFTAQLFSLIHAVQWDFAAAAKCFIDGGGGGDDEESGACVPEVQPEHAGHVLESFVNGKLFNGFENETFYLEGSLTSLLRPVEFRRDCFAQFLDMRDMEPTELLGILPTCQFGRFAGKKYLAVIHNKMEEMLFGSVEQRRAVAAGGHPRTRFYGSFLRLAKAMWLLHLLAFALDPVPNLFEAGIGIEFQPEYMESVVKFGGGRGLPEEAVVGFPVSPGFKLENGVVVRARVFVVPVGC